MVGSPVSHLSGTVTKKFQRRLNGLCWVREDVSLGFLTSLVRHICTWELLHTTPLDTAADFCSSLTTSVLLGSLKKRVSNSPMSRGLFVGFHKEDTQQQKRKQVIGSWLHPSETNKKNRTQLMLELPVLVWHTCPAVTVFNHTRPVFHQEQT